ncbi:MAG: AAA family ATPase [Planctomycetota bacterium]
MIDTLSIARFKSIRSLSIECRKVNLFIGAPDTGKTNILEALHLLSRLGWGLPLEHSLRIDPILGFEALFHNQFVDQPFEIVLTSSAKSEQLQGWPAPGRQLTLRWSGGDVTLGFGANVHHPSFENIRAYAYSTSLAWTYKHGRKVEVVEPPHGENLIYLARHHSGVHEFLTETLSPLGWKLRFDSTQGVFRLSEVRPNEIIDYPLEVVSDTLKRLLFYGSILLTSREVTLVFDEPDVWAFPPYPKMLGEMIAADESNQFFLTTHNPYFLSAIVEKTPADRLALFVCQRVDGATTAKRLGPERIAEVIEHGASVFFNLDSLLES